MNLILERLGAETFLAVLSELPKTDIWIPYVEKRLIRLWRTDGYDRRSPLTAAYLNRYCPITAVYFHITGIEIQSCFWVPEMTEDFGFLPRELVEISYATDGCDCGQRYTRALRNKILAALELPPENTNR